MKNLKSTKMENVSCVIGQNTKKPNTITMRVGEADILEAVTLFKTLREGNKPESGLIGYELVAVYADEVEEEIELSLSVDEVSENSDTSTEIINGDELVDGITNKLNEVMEGGRE